MLFSITKQYTDLGYSKKGLTIHAQVKVQLRLQGQHQDAAGKQAYDHCSMCTGDACDVLMIVLSPECNEP